MSAYPDAEVPKRIGIPGQWIWCVLIDRRCPVNGYATHDEPQKNWHGQPMTAPNQQVVPANHTHAGLILRHVCSDHTEMTGISHTYSPASFEPPRTWSWHSAGERTLLVDCTAYLRISRRASGSLFLHRSARCSWQCVQDSPPRQNDRSRDDASPLVGDLGDKLLLLRE